MSGLQRRGALKRMGLGAGALVLGNLVGKVALAQPGREIEVTAQRFQFTPNSIPIKLGERVTLLVKAVDFPHGFNVPDLGLRVDLMPGKVTKILIAPKEVGTIDFLCDNFCGDGHERMHGQFIVTR